MMKTTQSESLGSCSSSLPSSLSPIPSPVPFCNIFSSFHSLFCSAKIGNKRLPALPWVWLRFLCVTLMQQMWGKAELTLLAITTCLFIQQAEFVATVWLITALYHLLMGRAACCSFLSPEVYPDLIKSKKLHVRSRNRKFCIWTSSIEPNVNYPPESKLQTLSNPMDPQQVRGRVQRPQCFICSGNKSSSLLDEHWILNSSRRNRYIHPGNLSKLWQHIANHSFVVRKRKMTIFLTAFC